MTTDKSEGVILSTVKYGDNAVIVNALTLESGRRGYMAALGAGRRRAGLLAPLSVVEFVATGRRRGQMQRMTELRAAPPLTRIPFDPTLRAVAFFMDELLCRTVPDEVPDQDLYGFVRGAVLALDAGIGGAYNFHLFFMMRLAGMLGFAPEAERGAMPIFDMEAGTWTAAAPPHPDTVTGRMADLWDAMATAAPDELAGVAMSREERQELITLMTRYYKLHLPGFTDLKSQAVLAQLA